MKYSIQKSESLKELAAKIRELPAFAFVAHRATFDDKTILWLIDGSEKNSPQFDHAPLAALLDWFLRPRTRWVKYLSDGSREAFVSRGVLHLLDFHFKTFHYTTQQRSALTLIARRLIWLCAVGTDIFSQQRIAMALEGDGDWRVPRAGVSAPDGKRYISRKKWTKVVFLNCMKATAMNLLRNSSVFLQGNQVFAPEANDESLRIAMDRGLAFGLRFRGDALGFTADSTGPIIKGVAGLHQMHSAMTSMLAPDPRGLIATRAMLKYLKAGAFQHGLYDRMQQRSQRVLGGMIAALTGMNLNEVTRVSIHPPSSIENAFTSFRESGIGKSQKVIGYICVGHELERLGLIQEKSIDITNKTCFLLSFIGPSRNSGFENRISDQYILAPLLGIFDFVETCRQEWSSTLAGEIPTLGSILEYDALDRIRTALSATISNPYHSGLFE